MLFWRVFYCITCLSCVLHAGIEGRFGGIDDSVLDLSDLKPVLNKGDQVMLTGGMKRPGLSLAEIQGQYLQGSWTTDDTRLAQITTLDLSRNALDNNIFDKLTDLLLSLLGSKFSGLKILFLSHNKINANAHPTLVKWQQKFAQLSIVLIETPLYGTGIAPLLRLKQSSSQGLIFLKKEYLWDALHRVQAYRGYVVEGLLVTSWHTDHTAFYDSSFYAQYLRYYRPRQLYETRALTAKSLSPRSPASVSATDVEDVLRAMASIRIGETQ